jgi:hypothetical protein
MNVSVDTTGENTNQLACVRYDSKQHGFLYEETLTAGHLPAQSVGHWEE